MTAPLLELSRTYPQAQIHILISQEWLSLVEGFPGIHRIWTYKRQRDPVSKAFTMSRLAFQLRKENFDRVLNFHASPSSSLLALLTGAAQRAIHFHGHSTQDRYSTVNIPGKGTLKPIIERDMDTLRAFDTHIPAGKMPQLFPQRSEIQKAQSYFREMGLVSPVLAISLGASRSTKNWPLDRFAALAIEWCKKENGSVLILAGPTESEKIQDFRKILDDLLAGSVENTQARSGIRKKIVATHNLKLRELMAVLSSVSVFAGNDSGPKHLAIAVNTPTVTLFGPEHPLEWHPYPPERHPYFFVENLPCRKDADLGMPPWCAVDPCVIEEHKCMNLIGVNAVLEKCQSLIHANPVNGGSPQ